MQKVDIKVEITPKKYNSDGYELHDFIVDYANYNSWFADNLKYWTEYQIKVFNYKLLENISNKVSKKDFETFKKVGKVLQEEFENLKEKVIKLQDETYDRWSDIFERNK